MKIYTRTGDEGSTALFGGSRVSKADLRIEAYGTIDELNAFLAVVRDQEVNKKREHFIVQIQERLFTIGSMLATLPEATKVKIPRLVEQDIVSLEDAIDQMEAHLEPLRNFVLPGGHVSISHCHVARTVCRRAERKIVALHKVETIDPIVIKYINRLSDYLFVLARAMAAELSIVETPWKPTF
ncbi:cob(I)yrinic acid a,c-diamide adenosyltransferase [Chryseolinea sp. T2]|uniref:cob(I)yrinic acid a,c-diamide adenosyltransferase n=1 Tax=Chryseolinea sp. T2 TaxID=3129255 RepID=UPI00307868A1